MSDEGTNAFQIEVEEDLIAAALAAVERVERARAAAPRALAAELEVEEVAEEAQENPFNAGAWGEPPPSEVDRANQRAEAAERQLAELRLASADLEERNRKLAQQARAQRDRLESTQLRLTDAEATSSERERALNELRATMTAQEQERARVRQRQQRDLEDAKRFGADGLVRELLPALDNLDLALTHQDGEGAISADGVRMVQVQLHRALQKAGVERIDGVRGTSFDPSVHEAIQYTPDPEVPPGCIVETHQAGYRLHGRLLRAARVAVARAGQEREPTDGTEGEPESHGTETDDR